MKHLILVSIGATMLASCRTGDSEVAPADIHVVGRGNVSAAVTAVAELQPAHSVHIHNKLPGLSTIIYLIPEGQVVEQGQRLVELDASALQERRGELTILVARADADRRRAREEIVIRKTELGDEHPRIAQLAADAAAKDTLYGLERDRLRTVETHIASTVILAPQPGLVVYARDAGGRRLIGEGARVRERQTLLVLPDVTQMVAVVRLDAAGIGKLRGGQNARIAVDAFPGREFSGTLREVGAEPPAGAGLAVAGPGARLAHVDIAGETPPSAALKPGMSGSVTFPFAERENALVLPLQALRRRDGETFVWLATPDGPVERVVEVGVAGEQLVEVVAGIDEGARVYMRPPGSAPAGTEPPGADR